MNFVYALKFNSNRTLVVVSEISGGIKKQLRKRKRTALAVCILTSIGALFPCPLMASDISNILPYQIYRDFAKNKGIFLPRGRNIPLYAKDGTLYDTLSKAPMIDFRPVDSSGVATLISPGYIASVKNNDGYKNIKFDYSDNNSIALPTGIIIHTWIFMPRGGIKS